MRVASNAEVRKALTKALAAFGRRNEAERLSQGWVKDENGHMIPPGWVRAS